ncbi:MAG: sodium-dependent transporter [candidate division KSB1 bacterium]|nr:sodium-dependent transporter [candidate division KSB1 bacterium]
MILLTLRSVTLPGAGKGLQFYLNPDFSQITPVTVVMALGQALFSLSLGMGAMITYGSYISKTDNLIVSAGWVCLFDTAIAIMAGFLIFPALFAMNIDPEGGAGLVFVVLPTIFNEMPLGGIFGAGFFLLLSVAALTSTISLFEVCVSYLVDEHKWKRRKAALIVAAITIVFGIPSAISFGGVNWLSAIPGMGMGFLDLLNILLGNYSLTLGALLISVFVGYRWGIQAVRSEIEQHANIFYFRRAWTFLIRFVCPVAIFCIFVYIVATHNYF